MPLFGVGMIGLWAARRRPCPATASRPPPPCDPTSATPTPPGDPDADAAPDDDDLDDFDQLFRRRKRRRD